MPFRIIVNSSIYILRWSDTVFCRVLEMMVYCQFTAPDTVQLDVSGAVYWLYCLSRNMKSPAGRRVHLFTFTAYMYLSTPGRSIGTATVVCDVDIDDASTSALAASNSFSAVILYFYIRVHK